MSSITYIALGSNLENPPDQIKKAYLHLKKIPESSVLTASSVYLSSPLDGLQQPRYANAVASLETRLTPHELLEALQHIEHTIMGRAAKERRGHWASRVIDLDILLYGTLTLESPVLTIPHYDMKRRAFVLRPLLEITSESFLLPTGERLSELLAALKPYQLEPYDTDLLGPG